MKFYCKSVKETEDTLIRNIRLWIPKNLEWQPWFAWYPVQVSPKEYRWLETVDRRLNNWTAQLIRGEIVGMYPSTVDYVKTYYDPIWVYKARK